MPRDSASLSTYSIVALTNPLSPSAIPPLKPTRRLCSPSTNWPYWTMTSPPSAASFVMKLMTPAMASEPYCEAAPSRRTSTRLIAIPGIMPISAPCAPLPAAGAKNWMSAERCRRLPLIRISVWSGAVPRSAVGRTKALPSPVAGAAWNDGTRARMLSVMSAVLPNALRSSLPMTSMGTGESPAERGLALRVPVVMISSIASSCAKAASGAARAVLTVASARKIGNFLFIVFSTFVKERARIPAGATALCPLNPLASCQTPHHPLLWR